MLSVDEIHTYYGDSHVLNGISIDVDESEVVALLGRNGAGKTTTLRSIMGHQPPRRGTIELRDEDITGLAPEDVFRKGIGFVPEDRGIFPDLTVRENLLVGIGSNRNTEEALTPAFEYFPRLEERIGQKAGTLSGGEQQMLSIGRVIVSKPDVLLIDEPTEGLMPKLVTEIGEIIDQLNQDGHTIVLVEQNSQLALDVSDKAYIIEKGEVKYSGASTELNDNEAILEEYLTV
ncbi:ABC transporter ATP-binding protein [Halopenitus sp. POP-27]|uniref:ABC transporter ATP-binding protein n=1 Tax=Halopenitus sp. POP-27 TaxID=2994425 RepID=UPI00246936D9|nr:ABC transporter ATP-binding protein [Halopenitus sp. POP-27]